MGSTVYDGAGNALTEVFFESSITPIATLECYFYLINCITSVSNDAAGGGGDRLGGAADSLCEGFAYLFAGVEDPATTGERAFLRWREGEEIPGGLDHISSCVFDVTNHSFDAVNKPAD